MTKIEDIKELLKPVWEQIQQLHKDEYRGKISKTVYTNRLHPLEEQKNKLRKQLVDLLMKENKVREIEQQTQQEKLIEDAKEFNRQRREMNKYKEEQTTTRQQPSKGVKFSNYKPSKQQKKPITKKPPINKQESKKPITYKSLIIKALKHDKIDSEEKLLYVVNKWKPGKDKNTLRRQVRNIVSIIKKSDKYEFNDKEYKVIRNKKLR